LVNAQKVSHRRTRPRYGRDARRSRGRVKLLAAGLLAGVVLGCGAEWSELLNRAGLAAPSPPAGAFSSPFGATLHTVVAGARFPVALVFLPDGTLLYTEKHTGRVRGVSPDGRLRPEPLIDVAVSGLGDAGLLGMALDPNFAQNGFIYLGYTANDLPVDNAVVRTDYRVVRYTLDDGGVALGSERLITVLPGSQQPGHEGGNIHFGPDGTLYISIGDRRLNTFDNPEAQDASLLAGKMLRLNADGSIPADNPFGPHLPAFAKGLRNSFDFSFDPISGRLFATENGPVGDDELNWVVGGGNYGWPAVRGEADDDAEAAFAAAAPDYHDPLMLLGTAPTGIDFDTLGAYGPDFVGDLFVAEWGTGTIRRIRLSPDRTAVASSDVFAEGIPSGMNDLEFGPEGRIYVSTADAIYRLDPQN
jgi:glucose/arabinose dehydrogenase